MEVDVADAQVLAELLDNVRHAAAKLSDGSPWTPSLAVLEEELEAGQPFFFKLDLASSSRSQSDTPVASS